MEKIKILLVDDDRQNSELLRKFLEVEGYEVEYAENGRAGWEMYATSCPDLVLLDINMPLMNGFELAQKIREQDRDVLIFFLTDRTEKADRLKGFDLKGNDYIPKPFYPEELIAKIKERFEHRQASSPSRMTIGQTIFDSNLSTIEYAGTVLHIGDFYHLSPAYRPDRRAFISVGTCLGERQLCQLPRPQRSDNLYPQDARP